MQMIRRKRKNVWRRAGPFEFKRETKRFSDGSPWVPATDTLFIRIRKVACSTVETFDWKTCAPGKTLCISLGTYRAAAPIEAARKIRRYLLDKREEHVQA